MRSPKVPHYEILSAQQLTFYEKSKKSTKFFQSPKGKHLDNSRGQPRFVKNDV